MMNYYLIMRAMLSHDLMAIDIITVKAYLNINKRS